MFGCVPRISGQLDETGLLARLGEGIRHERLAQGFSQEELADAAGIDRSHMGRIERGQRNVTILNLRRIANALDKRISELFLLAGD